MRVGKHNFIGQEDFGGQKKIAKHLGESAIISKLRFVHLSQSCNQTCVGE